MTVTGDRMRDEAERLVAAAIAAISYAARGWGAGQRSAFATGSPECCVCPVCRAIAAVREPGPELADRLATGVGDLAAGVTALLRTMSRAGGWAAPAEPRPSSSEGADVPGQADRGTEFWESLRRKAADAAKAAARATSDIRHGSTVEDDPWSVATASTLEPVAPAAPAAPRKATAPRARKAVAEQTVAKKAVATKSVARKSVARKSVAKKAVAKKAVARKAVARKAVPDPAASDGSRSGFIPEGGA